MIARIESDEVTLVTMLEIPVIPIVIPFIDITHVTNGIRVQTGEGFLYLFVLLAQNLACSDGVDEEFADNRQIGRAAISGHAVIAFVCIVFILW